MADRASKPRKSSKSVVSMQAGKGTRTRHARPSDIGACRTATLPSNIRARDGALCQPTPRNAPNDDGSRTENFTVKKFLMIALSCFLCLSTPSSASSSDPFQPTIGEFIMDQVGEAIEAASAHASSKRTFNAKIDRARKDFFARYPARAGLKVAEAQFSSMLFEKDIYFLAQFMSQGTSPKARQRIVALETLTGGQLDGGIHASAWPSFASWVNGVRRTLGARNNAEPLFVFNQAKLIEAIKANAPAYEAYKLKRDSAEFLLQGLVRNDSGAGSSAPSGNGAQAASFPERWQMQCFKEADKNPDPRGTRQFCGCVIEGITPLQARIPINIKMAMTEDFFGNINAMWKSLDKRTMNATAGRCYK